MSETQGFIVPLVPNIERRLGYWPKWEFGDEAEETEQKAKRAYGESILPLLDKLPAIEGDIAELYYCLGKRQDDIALIVGLSQAGVSYRLTNAKRRLKYLIEVPQHTEEDIRRDLSDWLDPIDLQVAVSMVKTTNQSETAKLLGYTQGRTRYRFIKLTKRLEDASSTEKVLKPYAVQFRAILKSPNILYDWPHSREAHWLYRTPQEFLGADGVPAIQVTQKVRPRKPQSRYRLTCG